MAGDFAYLIRFLDNEGKEYYGNLIEAKAAINLIGSKAQVVLGNPFDGLTVTDEEKTISKVLCPLETTPIFQCIGVNYARHARETNFNIPSQPVVFTKPADSIAAPFDDIHVHSEAQSQLDYEGELCFIFGKDCKDVTESDAMDCVLGYTIGNDLSARNYIPQEISGFQMSYGKSFDAFAPFGPYIVHPRIVGDPHQLQLTTKVNGEIRQNEKTSDMIWKIRQIIPHLTRGRTVRAGTVCMTGTPSGVGWFMHPTGYVKHGDEVEVTIEKLGSIKNKVFFL
ncbi:Fumarylacetoacetase-like, C-terminal [Fusarium oxysporum f. sp. vasinfectum]|nr:Fumarylacetoacetase-like, C-terminal [Fusarium oxysporum f. sp. vasinfectum]KAK2935082.1 Fumarylacetoacetase-like, C-terminal [Fusarium oxysporum f. sp. vasinfectum]